jgi:hypothetical protein
VAESPRDFVAEAGGTYLWDRQPAGGDDQDRRFKFKRFTMFSRGAKAILTVGSYFSNLRIQEDANFRSSALFQKHRDDVRRRSVAEKLPLGSTGIRMFFVIGDLMFLNELDEIVWSKASQRRTAKVGIVGQEIPRAAVKIGEIAPATS